jgi:hypothetical protein
MKKIYFFLFTFFFLLPSAALAVETEISPGVDVTSLAQYVDLILSWILPFAYGFAILAFIFAGFKYITSQGNPDAINLAKDIIVSTLTGVVLLLLIRLILNQIGVH